MSADSMLGNPEGYPPGDCIPNKTEVVGSSPSRPTSGTVVRVIGKTSGSKAWYRPDIVPITGSVSIGSATENQTANDSSRSDDLTELNGLIQYQPGRISTDNRNEEK